MPDFTEQTNTIMQALALGGLDGDMRGAAELMDGMLAKGDDNTFYSTCCALVEATRLVSPYLQTKEGFYGIRIEKFDGTVVEPGHLKDDESQSVLWAMRFLTTYVNDRKSTLALFDGTDPEVVAGGFWVLLEMSCAAVRFRAEEMRSP